MTNNEAQVRESGVVYASSRGMTVVLALLLGACAVRGARQVPDAPLSLIPAPAAVERHQGHFTLREGARLIVDARNAEAVGIARRFAERLEQTRGIHLDVRPFGEGGQRGAIVFALDTADIRVPTGEGYQVTVGDDVIRVVAHEPRGLFYGSVTLWQLLTQETTRVRSIDVPELFIDDRPRFAWRGAMLDSARNFQSPAFVKRFIDQLALAKLNTFHWHLTDDQGWRIEIKRYPRLTEVGAWRRPAGAAGTDAQGRPVRAGGWYSQDEIRDIVRYAAERYVTIVPEIDMPGHMQAAIAAYPELGSAGDTPPVSPDWGVHSYILNVDESTIAFMDHVLDEVVDLFPGTYVHIGGDEAVKDQWAASSRVQARRRELGVADDAKLQGWFIARMQQHLAARGRHIVGWDEILEGDPSADATVMSWRGTQGGIDAARAGHDVVMSPVPDLYLDHLQGDAADEPPGRPEVRSLADIYAYEPVPAALDGVAARHIIGAQANLWTEHMRTEARVEHAAFPRLAALAEVLWSPPAARNWSDFIARLVPQLDRYRAAGIAFADSAFAVRFRTEASADGGFDVAASDQVGLPIRYRVDGGDVNDTAPLYVAPVHVRVPSAMQAATFLGARQVLAQAQREVIDAHTGLVRSSDELQQCTGKLTLRLEDDAPADGTRAVFRVDLFDPCWIWSRAPLDRSETLSVTIGQIPYNFQLWKDAANVVPRPAPRSASGELVVRRDGCHGSVVATWPLPAPRDAPALTTLRAPLARSEAPADLCFVFSASANDPLWTIDKVRFERVPP